MFKQYLEDNNNPIRVLVVDDDPQQRYLERLILNPPIYDVQEAGDGEEAITALQNREFDVVLMDRCMPKIDGDEACRKIREEEGNYLLPIIMVTGDPSPVALTSALNGYANDFIKKPYCPDELLARVNAAVNMKRLTDQLENIESVLYSLARMVEAKDKGTRDHCARLMHICTVFAEKLGLSAQEILALQRGSILHDIGKLGIPDEILLKQGRLTEQEEKVMQRHTVIGVELCQGLKALKTTLPIIRNHHERYDGSGYPDGYTGEEIPLLARIFQIADIYDALASQRTYKEALSKDETVAILKQETEQGWRDPNLVREFINLLQEDPDSLIYYENNKNINKFDRGVSQTLSAM